MREAFIIVSYYLATIEMAYLQYTSIENVYDNKCTLSNRTDCI